MSSLPKNFSIGALACALVALSPGALLASELPTDRQPLSVPNEGTEKAAPLILPKLSDEAAEMSDRNWATSDAETLIREAHLRRVSAAFGLAGSLTGMSVTCLLIGESQIEAGTRRGWRYAAMTTGTVAGLALVTGTVLWATTPPAPGRPRLAVGQGPNIGLTLTFF